MRSVNVVALNKLTDLCASEDSNQGVEKESVWILFPMHHFFDGFISSFLVKVSLLDCIVHEEQTNCMFQVNTFIKEGEM